MPKTIHIAYYALLREERGAAKETCNTEADTPRDLYEELRAKYKFRLPADKLKVVVNEAFVPWNHPLQHQDEVVFIPPVAGG